jgi:argininosuccinate synthase
MEKVVLAFSGGLDTSFCAVYLTRVAGLEVHAVMVDLGGFAPDELRQAEDRAYAMGVKTFTVINDADRYYQDCIRYLIFGNVLKNNTYPLSVSSERVFQATAIASHAKAIGARYIAHGSTGAGNDQVRFDMIFRILVPDAEILTPIRDLRLSRQQEIDFLREHGIDMPFEKAQYSINKGLWGTSVGGKETLTSTLALPESAFPTPLSRTALETITLRFGQGEVREVNGVPHDNPVDAIRHLQQLAGPYAIGRDTHVGDTIIGIKGRVGFEAAAPMIILKAHHLVEKHTLTKQQLLVKDQLSLLYGNYLHDGLVLDPVMRDIEAFFAGTQENVSGLVHILLEPYRFTLIGVETPHDLMSPRFGAYGEMNNAWSGEDVKGFAKIYANALSIYHQVHDAS